MDDQTPATPDPAPAPPPSTPSPAGEAPPAPRRDPPRQWRGEVAETNGLTRRKRGRIWPILAATLGVVLLIAFLATWFRPAPVLDVVPVWAIGTPSRPFSPAGIAQGERDRLAFSTPARNPLARALGGLAAEASSHDLADALSTLESRPVDDTLVVSLCARACCDPADPASVWVLPDDPRLADPRRPGWLPLHEVLLRIGRHPAAHKLLLLDLRPIAPAPALGVFAGDVPTAIRGELNKFPGYPCLVLASCDAGQEPQASDALRRSAFSFYLEEGLRGWADAAPAGGVADGRVTAFELAAYVHDRVERWSRRNRDVRQSPTLMADTADDFPLVVLPRGRRQPHMVLPDPGSTPAYPAWLLDGWKLRDGLRRDGVDRTAPRVVSRVEAALLTAEHDWRSGVEPAVVRAALTEALDASRARLAEIQAIPRPRPASLALESAFGRPADATPLAPMKAWLAAQPASAPAAAPGEAEAEARATSSIAAFYDALKPTAEPDLAAAAFRLAAESKEPARGDLAALDRLLRTRQPRPLYVETQALQRLAALPAAAWRPDLVRLALDVTRRGELAASRPDAFAWVRPLLDAATMARHEGETVLFARGYAPLDEAERLLRKADAALDEVLGAEAAVARSRRLVDEALDRLPAMLAYLDHAPELEPAWFDAARHARSSAEALARPAPDDPAAALERVGTLDRLASALDAALAPLRAPFAADRLTRLSAPSVAATPETRADLAAALDTPFPLSTQRPALLASLLAVDRSLNVEALRLDARDGANVLPLVPPRPSDLEPDARAARERLDRLRRGSLALLALAGLPDDEVAALRATPARLASAWADLPDRLNDRTPAPLADRIGRLVSSLAAAPRLDDPESNPTRRLRVAEFDGLRGWIAARFAFEAADLDGTPFDDTVAEEYRDGRDAPAPAGVAVSTVNSPPTLDPSRPAANVPLRVQLTGPPADATARVDVLTADPDWLEIRRGSPWPSARSPFPAVESSPLAFDLALSPPGPTDVPLLVRMRPEAEKTSTPVPLGFLVRSRLGGRTYHRPVPLDVVPASRRLRLALSLDPARPTAPVGELRLRPLGEPLSYYLYAENPTDTDRPVLVQLLDGNAIVPGCEAALTLKAHEPPKRISFGPPAAKPEADTFPLRGPLRARLLDPSDPKKVLAEAAPPVAVASARDYVRVVDARFEPAGPTNDGKARISFLLRAVAPIVGPPCPVELVLTPDRVPGLLGNVEGTLRGELAAEGDEALLFAEGLRLDERDDERGYAEIAVDGVPRAFVFRTTFARRGEATTPRLDDTPLIRLLAAPAANAATPYPVTALLDNPAPGGRVALSLGRYVDGVFRADIRRNLPSDKGSIRINPRGPGDAIRFEATTRDPSVALNVRNIRGRRELLARLLDADDAKEDDDSLPVVFDDSAPASPKLIDLPKYALKGAALDVRAAAALPGAGLRKVVFFFGKPVDGKLPPNTPTVEARPLDVARTSWAARLPVPDDRKGPVEVSVQFESGVGLSAFDTGTVNVVDAIPVEPGGVQGKVVEGPRPQAGLDIALLDPRNAEKARARTDRDGRFAFPSLPPGPYKLVCIKPTPPTRGEALVTIAPGQLVEATVEMLRTR